MKGFYKIWGHVVCIEDSGLGFLRFIWVVVKIRVPFWV